MKKEIASPIVIAVLALLALFIVGACVKFFLSGPDLSSQATTHPVLG